MKQHVQTQTRHIHTHIHTHTHTHTHIQTLVVTPRQDHAHAQDVSAKNRETIWYLVMGVTYNLGIRKAVR